MSLLSLSKSLSSILSLHRALPHKLKTDSLKLVDRLDDLIKETPTFCSLKIIKQIAYLCNYKFNTEGDLKLDIAEQLLSSWIKLTRSSKNPVPESICKLQVITLVNQSIYYEKTNASRAMQSLIQATKICENHKYKTAHGKLLKFICKLRECEMCISGKRFELGVFCAQKALKDVLSKLGKSKEKRRIKDLSMVAINTFYKIGQCEEGLGNRRAADIAYENAEIIGKKYLNFDKVLTDLGQVSPFQRQITKRLSQSPGVSLTSRNNNEARHVMLKIPTENIFLTENNQSSFTHPENNRTRVSEMFETKTPGRYYSSVKLQRLTKLLFEKHDPIILNSDNYFYNHISKALNLDENQLQGKVDSVSKQVHEHIEVVVKSKEFLKERKRVFRFKEPDIYSSDYVAKRINRIELKFENKLKTKEIKMKSKLKSKIYRKLLKSINIPTRLNCRNPPTQTLFFRPPASRRVTQTLTSTEYLKPAVTVKVKNIEYLNKEIEEQLEELNQEINVTPSIRNSPVLSGGLQTCALASSAIRPISSDARIGKAISHAMFRGRGLGILRK